MWRRIEIFDEGDILTSVLRVAKKVTKRKCQEKLTGTRAVEILGPSWQWMENVTYESSAGVEPMRGSRVLIHSVIAVMDNPSLEDKFTTVSELFFNKALFGKNAQDGA